MARGRQAGQHPELGLPEVRKLWQTEGLFSDHYLKARIRKNSWWPTDEQARPVWQYCQELYNKRYVACAQNNEAFTRQELLDKILGKLGFAWTDNLGLPDQDAEPDYILFSSSEEKEKVIEKSTAVRYRASVGILEAKKVNHPLSQISKHQGRYPHQQIRDYLSEAQILAWGILTNGNEWRLYCRDTKPSHFFGINFEVAIKSLENFKFFLALFSPYAFIRDAQGKSRLDLVRENSLAAQSELEEDLRLRIFNLVDLLANGFVERMENQIGDTDAERKRLYNNCLIFLYRLLFILYAEGRELLPVEPKTRKYYKELSLARLVGSLKNFSEHDSRTRTRLYEDISELCHLINGTDEAKNKEYSVPRYNGGLFDPNHHPELEKWRVCDAVLADVLRQLMFTPEKGGQKFVPFETVDYADLRVQQLGSIYEGLLEHHFARNEDGRLKLVTDKAERKATGTYYTPDYIVKYIVEHTLGPLLAEIEQSKEVKAAKKANRQDNSFADAVLRLNVCDPAMGSGHFLVEATTYLAEHIVYHPTTKFQAKFEKGESQEQAEIAYWRRRVVEACIYGVDLNPLAVELAKLSLWLTTIATDQPLNFLDHHLRCGNSLIGARLDQLGSLPEKKGRARPPGAPSQTQFTFGPDLKRAVADAIREIHAIEARASTDVATVKDKEAHWRDKVLPALAPYKAIADLWTSTYFGQPLDNETYIAKAQRLLAGNGGPRSVVAASGTADATKRVPPNDDWRATAAARQFFHWELEFPEVFFHEDGTRRENSGFDAVIGNPPYVRPHKLANADKKFFWGRYSSFVGKSDLYVCFLHLATERICDGGFAGMIVSKGWLYLDSFEEIRKRILETCAIDRLLETGRVFKKVAVDTMVFVIRRECDSSKRDNSTVFVAKVSSGALPKQLQSLPQSRFAATHQHNFDLSLADTGASVKPKVSAASVRLGDLAVIDFGLKTGDDKKFVRSCREATEDRPLLRGDDVFRYGLDYKGEYVWYVPKKMREHRSTARPGEAARFECPKLLVKDTSTSLGAAYDDGNFYAKDVLIVHHVKDVNPLFVLALLNSHLLWHFYRTSFPTLHVQRNELAEFPIRRIAFTTPPTERKRHVAKGRELYERCLAGNDAAGVVEFVEKQLREKRSDVIHDLLAFLAERMMAMNKEKQITARQFLTDLKDFHGIDARSLTPKTKLDEFWKLQVGELFAHFRANKLRFKEGDDEKLRARFQKAQDKLVPLDAQIEFTDRLIDQIVYRLYGLTPAEINLVEKSVKR